MPGVAFGFILGAAATLTAIQYFKKAWPFNDGEESGEGELNTIELRNSGSLRGSGSAYAVSQLKSRGVNSSGFLSDIVNHLWKYISPAIGATIKEIVEPLFAELLPGPLKTLRFTKICFGTVPICLDNVVVHTPKEGTVQFDMDVVWDGDCDIDLCVDMPALGKVELGVQSLKLTGRMSIWLSPLTSTLPVVSAVQYAFINPPKLDLDFTGMAQVANMAMIEKTIIQIIDGILANMMVLPNRMLLKLDPTCDIFTAYQRPIGIARIKVINGKGFQVEKTTLGKDIPDCYCRITCGANTNELKTKVVTDSTDPEWNESGDFLLTDHGQALSVNVFDEDNSALDADDFLGHAKVCVGELLLQKDRSMDVPLYAKGKPTGSSVRLQCDIQVLTPANLDSFEAADCKGPNLFCGLLTIMVTKASDVPITTEEDALLGSFVKVNYGKQEFVTGVVAQAVGVDVKNPSYDSSFHVPLTTEMIAAAESPEGTLKFTLMNGVKELGSTTVTHRSIMGSPLHTITESRKVGEKGAKIEFRVYLSGMQSQLPPESATLVEGDAQASKREGDVGLVTFRVIKGRGFRVEKKSFKKDDIPDCYCKVQFGSTLWKTTTIKDSCTPQWNESSKFPFTDPDQTITIDVFDEDSSSRDDDLGQAKLKVGKVLLSDKPVEVELMLKGKPTGAFITVDCTHHGKKPQVSPSTTASTGALETKQETAPATTQSTAVKVPEAKAPEVQKPDIKVPQVQVPTTTTTTTPVTAAATSKPSEATAVTSSVVEATTPVTAALESTAREVAVPPTTAKVDRVRFRILKARGLRIEKRSFQKDDVPDCYCKIQCGSTKLKSSMVKDDTCPEWNESFDFDCTASSVVTVDLYDEDKGIDDHLGEAKFNISELLLAGKSVETALKLKGVATGAFLTVSCVDAKADVAGGSGIVPPKLEAEDDDDIVIVNNTPANPVKSESKLEYVDRSIPIVGVGSGVATAELTPASTEDSPAKSNTEDVMEAQEAVEQVVQQEIEAVVETANEAKENVKDAVENAMKESSKDDFLKEAVEEVVQEAEAAQAPAPDSTGVVRLTAVKGRGFEIEKKIFKKHDIPDIYCKFKVGNNPQVFRTSTIKDNVNPYWNESSNFPISNLAETIKVEVWDANSKSSDDYVGSASTTVKDVFGSDGTMEIQLSCRKGKPTGAYITINCVKI